MKLSKNLIIYLVLFVLANTCFAQKDTISVKYNPYKLNYFVDIPITISGLLASKYGTDYIRDREPKHPEKIPFLNPNDIWWFDRIATKQDPQQAEKYLGWSNKMMRGAMWAPVLMYLDPKVRDIGFDFALLYLETQAINATAYLAAAIPISRLRPLMYNQNESIERRYGSNTTNSFFSGHASVVATSTFFMVKVYYDLHPEAKNKFLFYGLASIPPAITGYFRLKGAKHFPTDIITGFTVGALTGILVPELHKKKTGIKIYPVAYEKGFGVYARIDLK